MSDLGSIAEVIGAAAAILGLFYVGFQVRQNTRAVRANTIQALADQMLDVVAAYAADDHVARQTFRWMTWEGPADDPEAVWNEFPRVALLMARSVRQRETVFIHAREGTIDSSAFETYAWKGNAMFTSPLFIAVWPALKELYDPEFVSVFEARMAEHLAEPLHELWRGGGGL